MGRSCCLAVVALLFACSLHADAASRPPRSPPPPAPCTTQRVDQHLTWEVSVRACHFYQPGNQSVRGSRTPQRWLTECVIVNNEFPGPAIRANVGETIRVDLINNMPTKTASIHWHGLHMRGTPWADGASMITSCPTLPGDTHTYIFTADEAGTYFWHGHSGLEEEAGFSGAIIINDPNDPHRDLYEEEYDHPFEIRDWWFTPEAHDAQGFTFRTYNQLQELVSLEVMGHSAAGIPLVNGYFGDNSAPDRPVPVYDVQPDTCYRFRLIAANTQWPGWFVNITDDQTGQPSNLTLIAQTAQNMHPKNAHSIAFYTGQRADIVWCSKGTAGSYTMTFNTSQIENGYCATAFPGVRDCLEYANVTLRVNGTAAATTAAKQAIRARLASFPFYPVIDPVIHPELLEELVVSDWANETPSQTWNIDIGIVAGNMYSWDVRNWGYIMPRSPLLFGDGKCGVPPAPAPGELPTFTNKKKFLSKTVRRGEVVDIVFNNLSPYLHPMHLHGNDFLLMGSKYIIQSGSFAAPPDLCPNNYRWADPDFDNLPQSPPYQFPFPLFGCPYNATDANNSQYMLRTPVSTDIVVVPGHSWAIARVKFDNPGVWFLHCHITIHMFMGMGFVVNVGLEDVPPIPSWVDTSCGGKCQARNQVCNGFTPSKAHLAKCVPRNQTDYCPPNTTALESNWMAQSMGR